MKRAIFAVAALTFMGGAAIAAEGWGGGIKPKSLGDTLIAEGKAPPKPKCESIAKMKAATPKAKFTVVTPGQWHFVQGLYMASPVTPPDIPPGNGALLVEVDGEAGIVWTRGAMASITAIIVPTSEGGHGIAYMPMPLNDKLLAMLRNLKTGALDAEGDEL